MIVLSTVQVLVVFRYFNNKALSYMSEIFEQGSERSTRSSFQKLKQPLYKTNLGQKSISYLGLSIWNELPKLL